MGTVSLVKEGRQKKTVKRKKKSLWKRGARVMFHVVAILFADSFSFLASQKRKFALLLVLFVIVVGASSLYVYMQKHVLETSSFSDEYILEKLGKHMPLPEGYPISLVRVEDSEALKKELPFQTKLKNGDYIIVYPRLYIIYDAQHDTVVLTKESQRSSP